jgi:hypothetical protein
LDKSIQSRSVFIVSPKDKNHEALSSGVVVNNGLFAVSLGSDDMIPDSGFLLGDG